MEVLITVLSSLGVVGILQGLAIKLIKRYILKLIDNELDQLILKKLDPVMEKYLGDKNASELQLLLAQYLEDRAKALKKAAETDSYPNK